jgi:uncharacterized membrane protein
MNDDSIPPLDEDIDAPSSRAQIAGLVSDVRALAETEWDYAKARLNYSGGVVRKTGIYVLLALLAISAAAIALIVGLLLIIANYWGPWIATIIVVLVFSIAAYIFAISARKTARNLSFAEDETHG